MRIKRITFSRKCEIRNKREKNNYYFLQRMQRAPVTVKPIVIVTETHGGFKYRRVLRHVPPPSNHRPEREVYRRPTSTSLLSATAQFDTKPLRGMAASDKTPLPAVESDAPLQNTPGIDDAKQAKGAAEMEPGGPDGSVQPNVVGVEAEAVEEEPALEAGEAASEAATDVGGTGDEEATAPSKEPTAESQHSTGEVNNESDGNTTKGGKQEPGEESRCSAEYGKSKAAGEDGEKNSSGDGELGDKRRSSVEISSSDGEHLSRMDSEDRSAVKMAVSVDICVVFVVAGY